MIGHYLLTLSDVQEDRVLTTVFRPLFHTIPTACSSCLVATVLGFKPSWYEKDMGSARPMHGYRDYHFAPAYVYEELCGRFGAPRVNAAIRSRILSNRARRVLSTVRVAVHAD